MSVLIRRSRSGSYTRAHDQTSLKADHRVSGHPGGYQCGANARRRWERFTHGAGFSFVAVVPAMMASTKAITLPILAVLQVTLDAGPCGDLTFIAGANGRPFTKRILWQRV